MPATRASSRSYWSTSSWRAPAAAARLSPSAMNSSKNLGSFGNSRKLIGVLPVGAGRAYADRSRLTGSWSAERIEDDPGEGGQDPGRTGESGPRRRGCAGRRPSARAHALARADTHDRARDDLGRRDRHPEVCGREQDRCGGRLGGEAVDRLELRDPLAHRLHDPPAADRGPERQRRRRHDDDPGRHRRPPG